MKKKRKIPLRMCVGCREMKNKKSLVRIVKSPEGDVKVDITGKAKGRGAYLCKCSECVEQARKRKALSRALEADTPDQVYEDLQKLVGEDDTR